LRVGVLTSSRAEFGIYLPLLKRMRDDSFFDLEVIAFGTHVSRFHGYTIDDILQESLKVPFQIESLVLGDTNEATATAMGLTMLKFASFWATHRERYDLVLCIGDRYEMYAAVSAAVPFRIKLAHFHGGETSLGSIDNTFRHGISLCSSIHFVSTEAYAQRLNRLLDPTDQIYVVGAMSLDNVSSIPHYTLEEFRSKWGIDLTNPTILTTLHPETVAVNKSEEYARTLAMAINQLDKYQAVVTMPNSDASSSLIRTIFERELTNNGRVFKIENFGTKGYMTCMRFCSFLLGNTSSGIIEAASFSRYVINLGNRQNGRARSANVFDCPFTVSSITKLVGQIEKMPPYTGGNIYWAGGAVEKVVSILKNIQR
jgi:GDP/UDP-N,N'-diacetylbacillosamine 2-epimerase (hydrolysing)